MRKIKNANRSETALLAINLSLLFTAVAAPMAVLFAKAFTDFDGAYIGFANFREYFSSPHLVGALWNSLAISTAVSLLSLLLAFTYAYALTRAVVPAKGLFKFLALLPLCAPTMMFGIALIYLIGNKGVVTMMGLKLPLYGPLGIIISEVVYTFPQAFLILYITLSYTDNRLYEAARAMGTRPMRILRTITLPGAKFGLVSAFLVAFSLCFSDFGALKVVGGNYSVLATDIYKQVIGQQNFGMGSVVGLLLMIPAVIMFVTERLTASENGVTVSSRSMAYRVVPSRGRDAALTLFCTAVAGFILVLFGAVLAASLIRAWPYNMALTFEHFTVDSPATGGISSFFNSLVTALLTALCGTVFVFMNAWLVEKSTANRLLRQADNLFSLIPLALPGLSIGLAFIFFFNMEGNPLNFIYGTAAVLVLANIVHFYSVPYVTASSALKKLDREIEAVAASMAVPSYRTLFKVTVPMCRAAIFETALYFFVNAMVTISAVVFLYPADFKLASVAIVNMEDAGDIAPAAALSVLVILVNVAAKLLYEYIFVMKRSGNR